MNLDQSLALFADLPSQNRPQGEPAVRRARTERDQALERVERNANAEWKAE